MNKKVRAKILDMTYDRNNNLFKMKILDLDKNKEIILAIKGTDWGVTPDTSDDIISKFTEDMKKREKSISIKVDNLFIKNAKRNEDGKIIREEMDKINSNIDRYPINEVMNQIHSELKDKEDES